MGVPVRFVAKVTQKGASTYAVFADLRPFPDLVYAFLYADVEKLSPFVNSVDALCVMLAQKGTFGNVCLDLPDGIASQSRYAFTEKKEKSGMPVYGSAITLTCIAGYENLSNAEKQTLREKLAL